MQETKAAGLRTLAYCLLLVLAVVLAVWSETRPVKSTVSTIAHPANAAPSSSPQ